MGKYREKLEKANEAVLKLEKIASADYHREAYHFMPPAGWMNDPNGLIRHGETYHMFYQHHPYKPEWDDMYWGHAVCRDLLHWEHRPIAIAPFEPYDIDGVYSGSSVEVDREVNIFYTGVYAENGEARQCQCRAKLMDDGITVVKDQNNPVIVYPPEGYSKTDFRDPKVFLHDGVYYLVAGSSKENRGVMLLFTTRDFVHFTFQSQLVENDSPKDIMWECPDLVDFGDKQILFESRITDEYMDNIYFSGRVDFQKGKFTETCRGKLDYGVDYYAAQSFSDGNRKIVIAWMDMWQMEHPTERQGWVGAMTLPREIRVGKDGAAVITPCKETEMLRRGAPQVLENLSLQDPGTDRFRALDGDCVELKLRFAYEENSKFTIRLRGSVDGTEYTSIEVDTEKKELHMDRSASGEGKLKDSFCPFREKDGQLDLHIFVDHSSIEVFVNDGEAVMTNRIYPSPDSIHADLFMSKGACTLVKAEAYALSL